MTISSILPQGNLQSSPLGGSPLLSAGFGGFEGFFAALLSQNGLLGEAGALGEDGDVSVEGLLAALKGEVSAEDSEAFAGLFDFAEGLSAGLMDSDSFEYEFNFTAEELIVEVRTELTYLQNNGVQLTGIQSIDELAAAYEGLGMDPVAAQEKAIRTATAIDMMRQKVQAVLESPESAPDLLGAIFASLSADQQNGVVEVVHQDTQIRLHQITQSIQVSQKLSQGDVALKVLSGEPLIDVPKNAQELPKLDPAFGKSLPVDGVATAVEEEYAALKFGTPTDPAKAGEHAVLKETLIAVEKAAKESGLPTSIERDLKVAKLLVADVPKVDAPKDVKQPIDPVKINELLAKEAAPTAVNEVAEAVDAADLDAVEVQGNDVSRYAARRESQGAPEPIFQVKANAQGDFEVQEIAATDTSADNAEDFADEVLDDGVEIQQTRTEARSRVETNSGLERLARQAEITTQVNVKVRQLAANGGGQVKMLLNPPELGEMEVRLEITNRAVKGQIIVQSQEVADQLARDLRHLQQGLADAGLQLQDEGLTFLLQEQAQEQVAEDEDSQGQGSSRTASAETHGDDEARDPSEPKWRNVDKIVDVNV